MGGFLHCRRDRSGRGAQQPASFHVGCTCSQLTSLIVRPRAPFRRHSTPVFTLTNCRSIDTTKLKLRSTLGVLHRGGFRLGRVNSRIEEWGGSRKVSGLFSYPHTPSKNPPPILGMQAYIACARLKCGFDGGAIGS